LGCFEKEEFYASVAPPLSAALQARCATARNAPIARLGHARRRIAEEHLDPGDSAALEDETLGVAKRAPEVSSHS
jgi:hypothetical protein